MMTLIRLNLYHNCKTYFNPLDAQRIASATGLSRTRTQEQPTVTASVTGNSVSDMALTIVTKPAIYITITSELELLQQPRYMLIFRLLHY